MRGLNLISRGEKGYIRVALGKNMIKIEKYGYTRGTPLVLPL
jgi:hypothetical protein